MSRSAIAVRGPLIKSAIFAVLTILVLVFVSIELGRFRFDPTSAYKAEFTNVSQLLDGDPVMVNGVAVGKVKEISVKGANSVTVSFDVRDDLDLPEDSKVLVRYKNLTGNRYLEVSPGSSSRSLPSGSTIPRAQTSPALDLDDLLGGLEPLFEGLDPTQLNKLSTTIVSILQGEGGTIQDVLRQTTSVASAISERDKTIGALVADLNSVLGNLDENSANLGSTIENLSKLASGLSKDRSKLTASFDQVDTLATSLSGLLAKLRGPFTQLVKQIGRVSTNINDQAGTLNTFLRHLPGAYLRVARLGSRGAGYNLYVCALRVRLTGGEGSPIYTPWIGPDPNIKRCQWNTAPLETPEDRVADEKKGILR